MINTIRHGSVWHYYDDHLNVERAESGRRYITSLLLEGGGTAHHPSDHDHHDPGDDHDCQDHLARSSMRWTKSL